MLSIGEVQTSKWTSSKGNGETEFEELKGNLICLPFWQAWHKLESLFGEHEIKQLLKSCLKT